MPTRKKRKQSPGPRAARLKLSGPWGRAVKKAITKKRPKKGWPKAAK